MYRWIVYVQVDCVQSGGNPMFAENMDRAKEILSDEAIEGHNSRAWLYPYSDEAAEAANRFDGIGNPFDYPAKVIELGPRGGLKVSNA